MSATGWRATQNSRRPHSKNELKKHPPTNTVSKKRRTQSKDRNSALRLKGLL